MKNFKLLLITVAFLVAACSENEEPADTNGSLKIEFDNVVGSANLQLNSTNQPYTNSLGETFNVTWLTYYISNIKLKRADGSYYIDPVVNDGSKGYYLIDEADAASQVLTLQNIPPGEYTELTFTVGVDANQVTQGAQVGVLDPAKGLFWSWNSGYIFFAIEGIAAASTQPENVFQYHVGGYKLISGNANLVNNLRDVTLSFNGDNPIVNGSKTPEVHLLMDVLKAFNGPGSTVTFTANASRHSPVACVDIANNVQAAFVVDHIH
ncbi:MAG: hypothetical protein KF763_16595 [Cyclobacteriaceae bacterium]|nr:hypothetical protein [Cyclobacteriaceae bacterium]